MASIFLLNLKFIVCMALICYLSTECVTSIYELGFNYHALGFNYLLFTLIYDFSGIEALFIMLIKLSLPTTTIGTDSSLFVYEALDSADSIFFLIFVNLFQLKLHLHVFFNKNSSIITRVDDNDYDNNFLNEENKDFLDYTTDP